jgi:MFS family permease
MRMSITPTAATDVDRRLRAAGMQLETAVAFIGCLIVLVADTQSLSLIPLLPQLEKEYSLSPSQASWALSALTLAGAAWAPTLTRLGDKLGMRRLVLASLVVSVLGNLLSAVAHGFPLFVASRAVLGLSAAVPLIYAILRARSTSAGRTNRGVGVITVAIGIGIAVSYLLSGVIIQAHGSVRTVFWVMTALSVVTLALAWLVLPDAHTRSAQSVDWGGAIGVSAGLVCIVLAITEGNTWQWSSGQVIGLLIGGVAIFGLWALYESRRPNPLINVRRVFNRTSTPAFIVGGLCGALGIYTNLNEVTYLEMPKIVGYGLGLSVLECAYILCAISAAVVICGFVAAPLITRFGPRPVMAVAGAVAAADFFVVAYAHDQIWQYVIVNIVWGAAFALAYAAAGAAYLQAAAPAEAAMYSSANAVFAAAIAGVGPGIFTAILTSAAVIPHTPVPDPGVFRLLWFYAAFACVAIFALALIVRRPRFVPAEPPADAADPLVNVAGDLRERPEPG